RRRSGVADADEPYETGEFGQFDSLGRDDRFDQADRAGRRFEADSGVGPWADSHRAEADLDWGKPGGERFGGSEARHPGLAALAAEAGGHDDRGWDDGYSEPGRPYGRDPYDPGPREVTPAQLFGQITIYTLIEDHTGEFDRLTERIVAQVREQEPGTLAY